MSKAKKIWAEQKRKESMKKLGVVFVFRIVGACFFTDGWASSEILLYLIGIVILIVDFVYLLYEFLRD